MQRRSHLWTQSSLSGWKRISDKVEKCSDESKFGNRRHRLLGSKEERDRGLLSAHSSTVSFSDGVDLHYCLLAGVTKLKLHTDISEWLHQQGETTKRKKKNGGNMQQDFSSKRVEIKLPVLTQSIWLKHSCSPLRATRRLCLSVTLMQHTEEAGQWSQAEAGPLNFQQHFSFTLKQAETQECRKSWNNTEWSPMT